MEEIDPYSNIGEVKIDIEKLYKYYIDRKNNPTFIIGDFNNISND